jgi:putative transposase
MHRNPVTRGLVKNPEDWPWSTHRHYLLDEVSRVQITKL